jgi:hypothetical protein
MTITPEGAGSPSAEVGVMTDISVSYDGDPQSFYGGDFRLPLAIQLGNRTGEITATSSRWAITDHILTNNYVDVTLGFGDCDGGLTGTITSAKVVSYNVNSTQNDFVTSDIVLNIADPDHLDKGSVPPSWASGI